MSFKLKVLGFTVLAIVAVGAFTAVTATRGHLVSSVAHSYAGRSNPTNVSIG